MVNLTSKMNSKITFIFIYYNGPTVSDWRVCGRGSRKCHVIKQSVGVSSTYWINIWGKLNTVTVILKKDRDDTVFIFAFSLHNHFFVWICDGKMKVLIAAMSYFSDKRDKNIIINTHNYNLDIYMMLLSIHYSTESLWMPWPQIYM